MPFCEDCAKYWAPSAMREDGSCPTCGRLIAGSIADGSSGDRADGAAGIAPGSITGKDLRALAGKEAKAPWHFKLLVVLLVLYLVWRVLAMTSLV